MNTITDQNPSDTTHKINFFFYMMGVLPKLPLNPAMIRRARQGTAVVEEDVTEDAPCPAKRHL